MKTKTTASYVEATDFAPRQWASFEILQKSFGKDMSVADFEWFLANYEWTRKQFCEIFGVAESTLSGWLNGKGVPGTIACALQLAVELDIREEQMCQMADALVAAEFDARVVRDGEAFSLVHFSPGGNSADELARQHRQPVGVVVARGIPDLETGLAFVRAQSLLRTLRKAQEELSLKQPRNEPFHYEYRKELLSEINSQLGETPGPKTGDQE